MKATSPLEINEQLHRRMGTDRRQEQSPLQILGGGGVVHQPLQLSRTQIK